MKVYDISMRIMEGMLTYPGDPGFRVRRIKAIPKHSSNLTELILGTHTGSHVDSRRHIREHGSGVDRIPLERCMGPCTVIELLDLIPGECIEKKHLEKKQICTDRIILFKTRNSSTGYIEFIDDYIYLSDDAAKYLKEKSIRAVGIDYLSINKYKSNTYGAHCILLQANMPIFEGLDLSDVVEGEYYFIGFPLRIKDGDGSPVRAVLVEGGFTG